MVTTSAEELTASSTPDSSAPWHGSFAGASEPLKDALSSIASGIVRVFTESIYAAVGIFDKVFARVIHSDKVQTAELCIGASCITESQLAAVLSTTGQTPASPSAQGNIPEPAPDPTSTEPPPTETLTSTNSTSSTSSGQASSPQVAATSSPPLAPEVLLAAPDAPPLAPDQLAGQSDPSTIESVPVSQ